MKQIISVSVLMALVSLLNFSAFAQLGPNGYNPNSVRPVLEDDIMYRQSILRRINLLEKQNKPFLSAKNELVQVIIEAVAAKKIQPYFPSGDPRNNGFQDEMEHEACYGALTSFYDDSFGDTIRIRANELHYIDLKEDLIFDRRRSRMYWDIQALTIVMPQGFNKDTEFGEKSLVTFRFKDLYEYFKTTYEESLEKGTFEDLRAFWYNPDNPKRHISLADAFELRLFNSRITKVANPDDEYISDMVINEYGADSPETARLILYESQKVEYDLMEFEHNLWEF
jgi:gliding motility associated protien GldN